jgi:hypothetical protein
MEYHGPGPYYGPDPEPTFSEKLESSLMMAYPVIMPFIIMAIGVCVAIAVQGN